MRLFCQYCVECVINVYIAFFTVMVLCLYYVRIVMLLCMYCVYSMRLMCCWCGVVVCTSYSVCDLVCVIVFLMCDCYVLSLLRLYRVLIRLLLCSRCFVFVFASSIVAFAVMCC